MKQISFANIYLQAGETSFNSIQWKQKDRTISTVLTSSDMHWLAVADTLRTASYDFDKHEVEVIKELLATT